MAACTAIAYLLLAWIGFCRLSCGQASGNFTCENVKPCTCIQRKVVCKSTNLKQIPSGIPSDTTHLDLSHNMIEEIDASSLVHLKSLQVLKLNHNNIKSVPAWDSFPSSLSFLSIHHNRIKKLQSFNTTKQHSLKSLYLHVNKISSIGSDAFANLTRLQTLRLNRNKLKSIPTVALSPLKSLVTLDLRKNHLKTIQASSFSGLAKLKTLKLSKNRISGMEYYAFMNLDELQQLHLDGNNLTVLDVNWFLGFMNLQYLFLQNNKISQIKTHKLDWRSLPFLKEINLARNKLSHIDDLMFKHLLVLRKLNLAGNNIYHITKSAFVDLLSLDTLNLSNNSISWTAEEMTGLFIGLKKLEYLRLDNNRITLISEKAFVGLASLKYLNLSENAIGSIEKNAFNTIKHMQHLWLNTSHLVCDCKAKWLPEWLKTRLKSMNGIDVRCKLPQHLYAKSILSVPSSAFVCDFKNSAPQIYRHPVSKNALIGDNVTLHCDVEVFQKNDTIVKLSWRRNQYVINTNMMVNRAKATSNDVMMYTSQLRLVHVDFRDDGFYQCHVRSSFGESFSNRARLAVREFPAFTKKPKDIVVNAGDTIELPCAAKGHPKPTLSWRKDKGNTKFAAAEQRRFVHQEAEKMFLITHSITKDTGFYTCTASNDAGSISATAHVIVSQIPRFMQSMTSKTVTEGDSVVLECIANGNPKPIINWSKDGETIDLNSRVLTHLNGQILVIIRAQLDDEGKYECQVTNEYGSASQSAELKILPDGTEVGSTGKEASLFRYDKKKFLAIIVIVVVSCVVGTSSVWLLVIYCARRGSHRTLKTDTLNTNTAPRDDVSYIPLKSYSSGSTQTSRDSPRSTATFISGSQGSTFPPSNASSEQSCDCEKALSADTSSTETSKGSHCSLASTCPSVESEPVRQVIHVQIHNSDSDSCNGSPSHRKETVRDTAQDTIETSSATHV